MQRLNRSLRLALSAFPDNAVRYEDPRGNPRLRRQIARLVFRQGATCSPDDVLVTSGETEATNLAVRAVTRPGDVVAVESPGCYEFLQALGTFRLRAVEIPHVRGRGIDLDLLAAAMRKHRIKAILVTATCNNALGDCASDEAKKELVRFATEHEVPIIEGDPFGDLVFSGERPRPLKAFDTAGMVIQCCSLAHYVAPGFNLGWTCAGRWHLEVERLKLAANVAGARLPQLAMAEFLESGAYEKHVKQLRFALWQSVEASRQEILRTFPRGTRVSRPEGGFVLWVQLPEGHDGLELQQKAAAVGIDILPGSLFSTTRQYDCCIRIACGHPFEAIKPALRALGRLLHSSA
jgi:DNA-binding transcriptional MocR family regulator